ncbi:unnamed protein product [Triticum turgidum subsp. durum]|uniref:Uncharacterized protein n=1 Tax=Triticum turgidum subsp. durum TaxID=4567 RepID=A0A9R0ZQQ7_TRITD|nr:unnamed protein product [Triticum turgidum subsp. durum]
MMGTIKYITIIGIMWLSYTNAIQLRVGAMVVYAGLLHDHIFHMFGAGLADLVEGLRFLLLMDFDHCFRGIRIMVLVVSTFIFFGILKLLAGYTAIIVI